MKTCKLLLLLVCFSTSLYQPLYAIDSKTGPAQRIIVHLSNKAATSLRTKTTPEKKLTLWSRSFALKLEFVHKRNDLTWVVSITPTQDSTQLAWLITAIKNDSDVKHVKPDQLMVIQPSTLQ